MAAMLVVVCHCLLFFSNIQITSSSTHWIVTEDGRLQAQIDSMFSMRRPYDLVSLLKQEDRALMLDNLKQELLSRKEDIDRNEDKDTGLEQRFYKTDTDCIAAGKPLPEFDLLISTVLPLENKGIRAEDHIDFKAQPSITPVTPYCTDIVKLDYSVHSFEHLEGVQNRENLTGNPELGLKNAITHRDNVDDYGHLVYEALVKNKTSWVLYNMAAFYWRIKGDPYNVVECLRRALHYSPRLQKDVALISLANVLHRARYSNEAAIVVHAALDISKELNVNHFTLGNIYAVLAEYNKSVICFENTLKIQPDFEAAAKRKHAVLCHAKLESALEAQHKSLQRTLDELKGYQVKHKHWQQQNEVLLTEQAPPDVKLDQRIAYETQKIRELEVGTREVCTLIERDGRQILHCGKPAQQLPELDFNFSTDNKTIDQSKRKKPKGKKSKKGKKSQKKDNKPDYSKPVRPPLYKNEDKKKASNKKVSEKLPVYKDKEWPNKEECDKYVQKFPAWDEFASVYLPPENKGFEVSLLLTEAIDLDQGQEHPLPWYPPVCVTISEAKDGDVFGDELQSIKERTKVPLKSDKSMKETLLSLVKNRDVTEEEIGQRILSGLKKNLGPRWIMYNLAGLYWRVIGNLYHGIECLRRAIHFVPYDYFDVPLVNMANLLYRLGKFDDAIKLMRDAIRVNDAEPMTHYFMGNLLSANTNLTGAVWHYEMALQQDPKYNEAFVMLRTVKCYSKFTQAAQSEALKNQPTSVPSCRPVQQQQVQQQKIHSETRMVCRKEDGIERCTVESRTRPTNQPLGGCPNVCQQINTACGAQLPQQPCQLTAMDQQNVPPPQQACNGDPQPDPSGQTCFVEANAEDIKDFYRKQGLCKGKECDQIQQLTPNPTNKPHIKLEFVNGLWTQRLIFADRISDIPYGPTDCIFFNDGSRSPGCDREEYKPFEKMEAWHQETLSAENKNLKDSSLDITKSPFETNEESDVVDTTLDPANAVPRCTHKFCGAELPPDNVDLPEIDDSDLPDSTVHIKQRLYLASPTIEECTSLKKIDFNTFTSTWLALEKKGISLAEHVNFENNIRGELKEPTCKTDFGASISSLDHLKGIADRDQLYYDPETGLKEVLQHLGGEIQAVEVMGARISNALETQPKSWVVGVLAALYWRVEGNAPNAINCLRMALHSVPQEMKDLPLVSMANILHRAGRLNDAIVVTDMALGINPNLVLIHVTMANIYAAKGDWKKATIFYESTLGLQSSFDMAKERLRAIQCQEVFQEKLPKNSEL